VKKDHKDRQQKISSTDAGTAVAVYVAVWQLAVDSAVQLLPYHALPACIWFILFCLVLCATTVMLYCSESRVTTTLDQRTWKALNLLPKLEQQQQQASQQQL
jgi:hypothetical protein